MLVVVDSGQIEARVTAWLAGQESTLEAFRKNDALNARYKAAFTKEAKARGFFGLDGRGPDKKTTKEIDGQLAARGILDGDFYADKGSLMLGRRITKEENPEERQVSKGIELGLGFGMGEDRFGAEMAKGLMGAPPKVFTEADAERFNVDVAAFLRDDKALARIAQIATRVPQDKRPVHWAVARHLVRLYRSTNDRVKALWDELGMAIRWMAEMEPDDAPRPFGPGGVLLFKYHGMVLPSGLEMHYKGLHEEFKDNGRSDGFSYLAGYGGERHRLYGGKLTENAVQALARDVVFDQGLYAMRRLNLEQGMSTHDEVVFTGVPADRGEATYKAVQEVMCRPLLWCPDIPLNASGGWGACYGDIK